MSKNLKRHLSKDTQMSNKHTKWSSTLLVIKEIQTKITVKYHFVQTSMVIINKTGNNICRRRCGEMRTWHIADDIAK